MFDTPAGQPAGLGSGPGAQGGRFCGEALAYLVCLLGRSRAGGLVRHLSLVPTACQIQCTSQLSPVSPCGGGPFSCSSLAAGATGCKSTGRGRPMYVYESASNTSLGDIFSPTIPAAHAAARLPGAPLAAQALHPAQGRPPQGRLPAAPAGERIARWPQRNLLLPAACRLACLRVGAAGRPSGSGPGLCHVCTSAYS